jgi:tetratricopeptide (TPR) repeat protein
MFLGDTFFGGVPRLYNHHVAAFFYEQAIRFDGEREVPPQYAHHQLSRTYFIGGDLYRAMNEIELELFFHPDSWHTYYIKGLTLGYLNREKEATFAFGKFIEHYPESWAARNDKAWLHFRLGEVEEALETITPVVASSTANPWVLNTYGILKMNVGDYSAARWALDRAATFAAEMTPENWGNAYPGNHPAIYDDGLIAMRQTIVENQARLSEREASAAPSSTAVTSGLSE